MANLSERLPPLAVKPQVRTLLDALAEDMGVSVSWQVREAIDAYLTKAIATVQVTPNAYPHFKAALDRTGGLK